MICYNLKRENVNHNIETNIGSFKMKKRKKENSFDEESFTNTENFNLKIICEFSPCNRNSIILDNHDSYEMHILTYHSHVCLKCKKRFPSKNILELHIDENHNPFLKIQKENGEKVFKCFEFFSNKCKKTFISAKKRKFHLIDKHGYPEDFDFKILYNGI